MLDDVDYTIGDNGYQGNGNGYHGNGHNGYDKLDGDWLAYYKVAKGFTNRVKPEDREDFLLTGSSQRIERTFYTTSY